MESQYKAQLKSIVLNLRHILEGRYDAAGVWHPGDIEERLAALGVRRDREALPLEGLSHLTEGDHRARILNTGRSFLINLKRVLENTIE